MTSRRMQPALLVHGIWDTGAKLERMREALATAGSPEAEAMDLRPSDGSAPIEDLARQVDRAARGLADRHAGTIDLVGFSMGALVSRYFIQRLGGEQIVRRFVSISGPHAGTLSARFGRGAGVQQMRPGSALLTELAADPDPWRGVEVYVYWTPFDLMILPPRSSRLAGARAERKVPVVLHRWMVTDRRVVGSVVKTLSAP